MTCRDCNRVDGIDFLVATPIWNLVMTAEEWPNGEDDPEGVGGVLCLACFDKRACAYGVEYRDRLVIFGMFAWQAGTYDGGMPA